MQVCKQYILQKNRSTRYQHLIYSWLFLENRPRSFLVYCMTCKTAESHSKKDFSKACLQCKKRIHYRCLSCGRNCKSYRYLMQHQSEFCPAEKTAYNCENCDFFTNSLNEIARHMQSMHNKACNYCGKIFTDNVLKEHQVKCMDESIICCSICDFKTFNRGDLLDHVTQKHI